ncbi:MAG: phage tail tape measure protein [Mesorhizobium sp.]
MDEGQQLAISFKANLEKYNNDLLRARSATNDNFRKMRDSAKKNTDDMAKITGKTFDGLADRITEGFAPFMRGGVVFAGVAAAAGAVKQIADSIAEVDREARKAGVSAQTWQRWTYVATAAGASVDGITDALKEMNIRANEFALTGKGSGAEWFTRLGYSAEEVGRKLQDPNRFLDEIIGKLQKLDSGSQTRALDELFGGQGAENLAKVLGLSVQEIQRLRSEAATFTDEQIAAAKRIDAEWDTVWRNFSVYSKKAALESAKALAYIMPSARVVDVPDNFVAGFKLKEAQAKRDSIQKQLQAAIDQPDYAGKAVEIRELKASLQAVEEQIIALGGGSDQLKQALKELSILTQKAGGTFNGAATSVTNFKTALQALKEMVPGLKAELDTLGKLDAIDAAFKKAVGSATTMGQVLNAVDVANRAKTIARYGAHDNILDLIGATESGGDYNSTLDNGRWTGGAQNLTSMTLDQIQALQARMRTPENRALYGDGKGSSALGKYQITGQTLQGLMKELGLTGDRLFDQDTQDELARALLRRRGNDPAALRQEWAGLKNVDDGTIRDAYNGTPTAAQKLAPTDGQQKQIDLANQQTEARKRLNQAIDAGLSRARFEQQISGMSAQQQRIELEVYDRVAQAKRDGVTLTDGEIAKMREKIATTQQLDVQTKQAATSQQQLQQAGLFFGEQFTGALSGLLTGTATLNGAVRSLINSLIDATLQAALLGKGPLAGLFGGAGGGIFGAIFGFSDGGFTGSGGKYEPKGVVHGEEYVLNREATRRIGVPALDALNSGRIPGFDRGGYVGDAPAIHRMHVPANTNINTGPAISISAPITVNGSAGTPEQNQDLAKRMQKQLEATMRGVVSSEIQKQTRPGNVLNSRAR